MSTKSTTPTPAHTIESIHPSSDNNFHLPALLVGDLPEAAATLLKIDEEAKKTVNFNEVFHGFFPGDTGVTLMRLLRRVYGFVSMEGSMGFFGPTPPRLLSIRTGPRPSDTEPMVFGDLKIPALGPSVTMSIRILFHMKLPCLAISGSCENRHLPAVKNLFTLLKEELANASIYRGHALSVSFAWAREEDPSYDVVENAPRFLDLSRSNYRNIILTAEAQRQVTANLFLPITNTPEWNRLGFPKKTGVLMQGPPGCGKTETLLHVANLCTTHSWTYIQCESVEDLQPATSMALSYQPCVIAVEDIDKATQGRSISVDSILNIIDGTETKNRSLLFVATTNDVDSITDAMLRPGRLGDGFIYMGPPDAVACEKLIRATAGASLPTNADLSSLCEKMANTLPAVIVATVQAARKYALVRTGLSSDTLSPQDLHDAFTERTTQLRLLTRPIPDTRSELEKAASIISKAITPPTSADLDPISR